MERAQRKQQKMIEKEIFNELEEAGDFIDMGYQGENKFFTISKINYERIKAKHCDPDWTGY